MGHPLVTFEEIESADAVVDPVVRRTPLWRAESLSSLAGRPVLLKNEHLQRTGSFKIRGALSVVADLGPDVSEVVAGSSGNHAQGVALAAAQARRAATVFMPTTAPLPKVQATEDYGADVRLEGETVGDAVRAARAHARETGAHFIPPFDDRRVIAGQGTVGLELAEQVEGAATVLVPIGGGGLISGIAAALAETRPELDVVGVQAEGASSMRASLEAGEPVAVEPLRTIADGIAVPAPSELTLAHVEALVERVVTVDDEAIGRALVLLLERAKAVVEPAGAVGLAAVLAGHVDGDGPVVVVLSGGNVDPLLLGRLIDHGLAAAGRFAQVRVVVPDRPGSLAGLARVVAGMGVNILDVEHHRTGVRLGLEDAEILLTLETRDRGHGDAVADALREAGARVERLA